jgi:hypothetical protein
MLSAEASMIEHPPEPDTARDHRTAIARHLADLHRLHLALAADSRRLKQLSYDGHGATEIEIASEMLEQYMASTAGFLENMRGRFEARLSVLRRAEPKGAEFAPGQGALGHGRFWLSFSRLCVALKQAERRTS